MISETTSDRPRGIQWTLVSHLEEHDFADDLADMSATQPSPGKIQLTKQFCKANRTAHYRYKDPGDLLMSIPLQHSQSPSVERNLLSWIALTISLISKALLVMTMVPIKITRLALLKPEVLSVDSATSGSLRSGFKATLVRLFF